MVSPFKWTTASALKKESTNLMIIICILSWEEGFRNPFFLF